MAHYGIRDVAFQWFANYLLNLADDSNIVYTFDDNQIDAIQKWRDANKLTINLKKTNYMFNKNITTGNSFKWCP